jgi:hypothetical protein
VKFVAFILVFFVSIAHADEPLFQPSSYRTCDTLINFCAYSEVGKNTTVYAVNGKFNINELYQIPGWHRSIFISQTGKYVAIGYSGLNLVNKDVTAQEVMLTIYENGKLVKEYTLGQLLHTMDSLKPTSSHYHWGSIIQVDDYGVELETVEGLVGIVHSTGKIYLPNES